jgi:hypothetical protein
LPSGGVIEVRVTDESGVPVEGAFVQAQRPEMGRDGELILRPTIADTRRNFSTDDLGVIRLYDLQPGSYYVSATPPVTSGQRSAADRRTVTARVQTFHPGATSWRDAQPIELGLGDEIHVDLVLGLSYAAGRKEPGGAITIHVTDDAGNPRAGVEVRALEVMGEGAGRKMVPARIGTASVRNVAEKDFYTDDRGDARIYGLPLGDYVVAADPLLGTVVDPERSDRELTYVPIYFPGSPSRADAQALSIRPWDDVNLELALTPTRAARISGRVVRWDGEPGRTFVVLSRNPDGPLYPRGLVSDALFRVALVDGEFTFPNVQPGDYVIRTSYDPDSDERDGDAEVAFVVDRDDVTGLVLTTVRGR